MLGSRSILFLTIFFSFHFFWVPTTMAQGQDVELDSSFGSGGTVQTDLGGGANADDILIQPDGKIVVTGLFDSDPDNAGGINFAMVRYNPDGSPDTSFAGDGIFVFENMNDSQSTAIVRTDDGSYILGGRIDIDDDGIFDWFMAIKINSDGSGLDGGFGSGGVTFLESDYPVFASKMLLQGDGKILLVGAVDKDGNGLTDFFALVRWNANGIPDAGFDITGAGALGPGGLVISQLLPVESQIGRSVAIQNGKIVVGGQHRAPGGTENFAVARFNMNDGSLDTSFGNSGYSIVDGATFDDGRELAIQSDGKILMAGSSVDSPARPTVLRLNVDGSPDATFGLDGVSVLDIGGTTGTAASTLALQSDGHILIAGGTGGPEGTNFVPTSFFLARVDSNGDLDTGFGNAGIFETSLDNFSGAGKLALRSDGNPVAAGFSSPTQAFTDGDRFALVAYTLFSTGGGDGDGDGDGDSGGCSLSANSSFSGVFGGMAIIALWAVFVGALARRRLVLHKKNVRITNFRRRKWGMRF